jgi:hypothetical protein
MIGYLLSTAAFLLGSLAVLLVIGSAALMPFMVAAVIVELRELREQVEKRPACDCRRPVVPFPRHRFGELLDD